METRTARGQMVYSSCKLQRLIMDNLIIHLAIGGKCKQTNTPKAKKNTHTHNGGSATHVDHHPACEKMQERLGRQWSHHFLQNQGLTN